MHITHAFVKNIINIFFTFLKTVFYMNAVRPEIIRLNKCNFHPEKMHHDKSVAELQGFLLQYACRLFSRIGLLLP